MYTIFLLYELWTGYELNYSLSNRVNHLLSYWGVYCLSWSRHRVSKKGQPSQTSKSEAESRKTQSPEQPRQDTQSTKEVSMFTLSTSSFLS